MFLKKKKKRSHRLSGRESSSDQLHAGCDPESSGPAAGGSGNVITRGSFKRRTELVMCLPDKVGKKERRNLHGQGGNCRASGTTPGHDVSITGRSAGLCTTGGRYGRRRRTPVSPSARWIRRAQTRGPLRRIGKKKKSAPGKKKNHRRVILNGKTSGLLLPRRRCWPGC